MTKIFNKAHPDFRSVKVRVYKDDGKTPISEGVTSIRKDGSLKFTFDVNVFFGEDAEFGTVAQYRVAIEQWKSGKGKPIDVED
jgi:isopropylmalate/homocitrate/citramalate synthase